MAAFPVPPPPAAQQPDQQQATAYSSRMSPVNQPPESDSRRMAAQGLQVMATEVQTMVDSAKKIAQVGEKMLPSLSGDLSKLVEILASMKGQVQEAMQAQQGSAGAQPQPQQTPSPTDVPQAA